jgi:hypothetical protein
VDGDNEDKKKVTTKKIYGHHDKSSCPKKDTKLCVCGDMVCNLKQVRKNTELRETVFVFVFMLWVLVWVRCEKTELVNAYANSSVRV